MRKRLGGDREHEHVMGLKLIVPLSTLSTKSICKRVSTVRGLKDLKYDLRAELAASGGGGGMSRLRLLWEVAAVSHHVELFRLSMLSESQEAERLWEMWGGSKWTDDDDDVIEVLHVTGVLSFGSADQVEHAAGAAGVRGLLDLKSSLQARRHKHRRFTAGWKTGIYVKRGGKKSPYNHTIIFVCLKCYV